MSHFQMGMGATRMGQPNATQLQNQYLPQGQFPGSSPGLGSGPSGMNQPGPQTTVPQVRIEWCSDCTLLYIASWIVKRNWGLSKHAGIDG